jgi:hypothetical protein
MKGFQQHTMQTLGGRCQTYLPTPEWYTEHFMVAKVGIEDYCKREQNCYAYSLMACKVQSFLKNRTKWTML